METNNPRVIFLLGIVYGWFATLDTKKVWSKHRGARSHRVRRANCRTIPCRANCAVSVALVKSRELRPSRGPHQALSVIVNVFRGMSADDFLEFMNLKNLVNFHTSLCLSGSWILENNGADAQVGAEPFMCFFLEVVPSPKTFQREEFPNKVNIGVRSHINLTLFYRWPDCTYNQQKRESTKWQWVCDRQ